MFAAAVNMDFQVNCGSRHRFHVLKTAIYFLIAVKHHVNDVV